MPLHKTAVPNGYRGFFYDGRIDQMENILQSVYPVINLAERNHYVRPALNEKGVIHIKEGRHPVVEHMLSEDMFIRNISTIKVLWPLARSSEAPTRVKIRSTIPISADLAGIFATHYHELTELEGKMNNVNNYCIAVKEKGEDIVFLRKIVKGGADKSYGRSRYP